MGCSQTYDSAITIYMHCLCAVWYSLSWSYLLLYMHCLLRLTYLYNHCCIAKVASNTCRLGCFLSFVLYTAVEWRTGNGGTELCKQVHLCTQLTACRPGPFFCNGGREPLCHAIPRCELHCFCASLAQWSEEIWLCFQHVLHCVWPL